MKRDPVAVFRIGQEFNINGIDDFDLSERAVSHVALAGPEEALALLKCGSRISQAALDLVLGGFWLRPLEEVCLC